TVMHLFLVPLAWAGILAYSTWPLYLRLRNLMRGNRSGSALLMTLLLALTFVLPMLWLALLMRTELTAAYGAVASYFAQGPHELPEWIAGIPEVGLRLQEFLDQLSSDP